MQHTLIKEAILSNLLYDIWLYIRYVYYEVITDHIMTKSIVDTSHVYKLRSVSSLPLKRRDMMIRLYCSVCRRNIFHQRQDSRKYEFTAMYDIISVDWCVIKDYYCYDCDISIFGYIPDFSIDKKSPRLSYIRYGKCKTFSLV